MVHTHRPDFGSTSLPRAPKVHAVALLLLVLSVGCSTSDSGGNAIDREVFIETYVDLRISALQTDSQRLAVLDREAILAEHGVVATDLTHFATTYSDDVLFMRDVWNEVESRMDVPPSGDR